MTTTKHTPGPWVRLGRTSDRHHAIGPEGETPNAAPVTVNALYDEEGEANADFIVRACNAHEDLLEALEALVEHFLVKCEVGGDDPRRWDSWNAARAAIAKAKGEQ